MHLPQEAAPGAATLSETNETLIPTPEQVRANYADRAREGMPAEQLDTLVQFFTVARQAGCQNFAQAAALVSCNPSTMSKLARGKYHSSLGPMCRNLDHYLRERAVRGAEEEEPLVETSYFQEVVEMAKYCRFRKKLGFVFGPSHVGKSWAFKWCARNLPRAKYARMPAGGGKKEFMKTMVRALGGIPGETESVLREQVLSRLGPDTLVLLDQFHEALDGRVKVATIAFVLEMYDEGHCPIIISGTDAIAEGMNDKRVKKFMQQLRNRAGSRFLRIDHPPTREDLLLIAGKNGLPEWTAEARKVAERVVKEEGGFVRYCDHVQDAKYFARARKVPVTWEHFLSCVATSEAAAQGVMRTGGAK